MKSSKKTFPESLSFTQVYWIVLFSAGLFASLIPALTVKRYPFVDYPVHLTLFDVFHDLLWKFSGSYPKTFIIDWFSPYLSNYLFTSLLCGSNPETSGIVTLIFYLFTFPLAFLYVLRELGSDYKNAILIFPLMYNFNLSWGFLPFLFSLPFFLIYLGILNRFSGNPSKRLGFSLALILVFLFFTHLFTYIIALMILPVILLTQKRQLIHRLFSFSQVIILPGLVTLLWFAFRTTSEADIRFFQRSFRFMALQTKFKFFPDFVISGDPGYGYRVFFFGIVTMMLVLFLAGMFKIPRNVPDKNHETRGVMQWFLPGFFFCLYCICPYSLFTAVWLPNRIAFLLFICLILPLPSIPTPLRIIFDAVMTGITIYFMMFTSQLYMGFEKESQGVISCIETLEPGYPMQTVILNSRSDFTDQTAYDHIGMYYQIRRDGIIHNPFAVLTHMPVKYNTENLSSEAGYKGVIHRTSDGIEFTPDMEKTRYFLIRTGAENVEMFLDQVFKIQIEKCKLICRQSGWVIVENTEYVHQ